MIDEHYKSGMLAQLSRDDGAPWPHGQNSINIAQSKTESEIQRYLGEVEKSAECVQVSIAKLVDRLSPVMRAEPPPSNAEIKASCPCPGTKIAVQLDSINAALSRANIALVSALNRLGI